MGSTLVPARPPDPLSTVSFRAATQGSWAVAYDSFAAPRIMAMESADLAKLKLLLDDKKTPLIAEQRKAIRIEAENFRCLNEYRVEYSDREASHRLCAGLRSIGAGSIRTTLNDIYVVAGRYDVEVRYFDEKDGRSHFSLYVNRTQEGAAWRASADDESWKTWTMPDVAVSPGDDIVVEVQGDSGEYCRIDYVQLNYRGPDSAH